MDAIQNLFSSREIALMLLILIAMVIVLFIKSVRKALFVFVKDAVKILLTGNFLILIELLVVYFLGVIYLLYKLNIWNIHNLKDTIFWLIVVGFAIIFNSIRARTTGYFKKVFFNAIKLTILLEFISNLYSFGIIVEFILLLVVLFLSLLLVVSEQDDKNYKVSNILKNILAIIGFTILFYSVYMTIIGKNQVLNTTNLNSLLLPSILTLLSLPFMYFLAIISTYEMLFVRIDITINDKRKARRIKIYIIWTSMFNFNKIKRTSNRFDNAFFYRNLNYKDYIKSISKKNYSPDND